MTDGLEISPRLERWAQLAGYSLTQGSRTADGRAVLWASLGEIRLLIGRNQEGWFVISDSDRMEAENFVLAAPSMTTIEKYLFGRFTLTIRSNESLPRVRVPIPVENGSMPFRIATKTFEGIERFALIGLDDSTIAVSSADRVTAAAELNKLSRYLTATIDEIEASATNPGGEPLFER
jgi:hypothetical protein